MVRHWSILIISFRVTSLALGQSYDCPRASEVIPTSIDKRITWINRGLIIWPQQSKAKQNHVHTETWELSLCQLYHHWWHRLLCHQWWQSWHYDLSQIPVHILWARLYPVIPLAPPTGVLGPSIFWHGHMVFRRAGVWPPSLTEILKYTGYTLENRHCHNPCLEIYIKNFVKLINLVIIPHFLIILNQNPLVLY